MHSTLSGNLNKKNRKMKMTDYQNSIWNWCRLEQIVSFKQQRILTALSSISRSVIILWCFLWSSVPFLFFKLGKVIRVPLLISCPKVIFMYCRKRLKRWQSTSTTGRVPMWFRHFGGMLVQVNDIVYGSWSVLLLVVTLRGYEQNLCYRIPRTFDEICPAEICEFFLQETIDVSLAI